MSNHLSTDTRDRPTTHVPARGPALEMLSRRLPPWELSNVGCPRPISPSSPSCCPKRKAMPQLTLLAEYHSDNISQLLLRWGLAFSATHQSPAVVSPQSHRCASWVPHPPAMGPWHSSLDSHLPSSEFGMRSRQVVPVTPIRRLAVDILACLESRPWQLHEGGCHYYWLCVTSRPGTRNVVPAAPTLQQRVCIRGVIHDGRPMALLAALSPVRKAILGNSGCRQRAPVGTRPGPGSSRMPEPWPARN